MKNYLLSILFICCFLFTAAAEKNTLVMGKLTNVTFVKEIEFQVNQRYLNNRIDNYRSKVLEDGTFAFAVEINEPQVATILYSRNKSLVYLEPGDTLIINSDANSFQYSFKFEGPAAANNEFYAQYLKIHPPSLNPLELLQYKKGIYWFANTPNMDRLMQTQGVGQFTHTLKLRREKAKTNLEFFVQNNADLLSDNFVDFMRAEVTYNWAYHMMLYGSVYKNVHQVDDSFFDYLKDIPLENDQIGNYWYRHFLQSYINYRFLQDKRPTGDGSPFITQYQIADTILTSKSLAFVQSELIRRAFDAKHTDEALPHYAYFVENNPYGEFDEKVVRAFQKAMRYAVGTSAPSFTATEINNQSVSLEDYNGKVIFLNFWASWCRPCMEKMKELKPLLADLEAKDIVFLNVSLDRKQEAWQNAISRNEFSGIHIMVEGGVKSDIAKSYEVRALPEYFIIDKNGKFAEKPIIYDVEELKLALERLNRSEAD